MKKSVYLTGLLGLAIIFGQQETKSFDKIKSYTSTAIKASGYVLGRVTGITNLISPLLPIAQEKFMGFSETFGFHSAYRYVVYPIAAANTINAFLKLKDFITGEGNRLDSAVDFQQHLLNGWQLIKYLQNKMTGKNSLDGNNFLNYVLVVGSLKMLHGSGFINIEWNDRTKALVSYLIATAIFYAGMTAIKCLTKPTLNDLYCILNATFIATSLYQFYVKRSNVTSLLEKMKKEALSDDEKVKLLGIAENSDADEMTPAEKQEVIQNLKQEVPQESTVFAFGEAMEKLIDSEQEHPDFSTASATPFGSLSSLSAGSSQSNNS